MGHSTSDKFEDEYAQIKSMVVSAKEAEEEQKYKLAKSFFLDAASLALQLSKQIDTIEEVTFRNIARILVDNAKEMQLLIEMQNDPLPQVPGKIDKRNRPKKPKFSKKDDPSLLQLMIIRNSGIPVYTYVGDALTEAEKGKINDILFSGAITAINSLISEVLSKPIQSIQIENGNITIRYREEHTFVTFSRGDPTSLEDNIEKFSTDFTQKLLPRFEADLNRGKTLGDNEEVLALVKQCFIL